jgi:K+-sensing histidine kinase KdpD
MLGDAINETERLNTLCNNILLSSQLESGGYKINMNEFNCTDMVDQAVEQFRKRYPERVFQWKPECECYVRGEEFLIGLVLNNLLENAIKYTPPSSPIMVSLAETDNDCIISVADLGAGIPDHEKTKVFEKFYRMEDESRRKTKGTGLGLYLSQRIVRDHHGKMLLVNNQPSGSVFNVILPKSSI